MLRRALALVLTPVLAAGLSATAGVGPGVGATLAPPVPKVPVARGGGGAVATVDLDASRVAIAVLRDGGTAADAAVAAAATLGVTEPFSAGIGGGGYFVHYDAGTGLVQTIDGRETAPQAMREGSFVEDGQPIPFDEAVASGLSVGVPGTAATWQEALRRWGTLSLADALAGASAVARRGFVVDQTFRDQIEENRTRFAAFVPTRALFLPGGRLPRLGSVFRNPDLAATYDLMSEQGTEALYRGALGREVVRAVRTPPVVPGSELNVRPGLMRIADLASYAALVKRPTMVGYRGLQVYGMAPSSSGGSTVGEALNILERSPLSALSRTQAAHRYLEASALAFADRNAYVGDPEYVDVPLQRMLSDSFAATRACQIDPFRAAVKPVRAGSLTDVGCASAGAARADHEGLSTTHLTVADRWGDVVAYTLTIEQTGGSGIVVPGRGFLLNNELTDFNFTDTQAATGGTDPNLPAAGKRPRSSMSPTIVLRDGKPLLALGSPGGSTIITTVLQTLVNRFDLGMTLPQAVAAPRATQRNTTDVVAEPAFPRAALERLGHTFTEIEEIGAAAAVEIRPDGSFVAAAEPSRRGGGSALVVRPISTPTPAPPR